MGATELVEFVKGVPSPRAGEQMKMAIATIITRAFNDFMSSPLPEEVRSVHRDLMQRLSASSIFLAVQNHSNGCFKGFAAHGILAGPTFDQN